MQGSLDSKNKQRAVVYQLLFAVLVYLSWHWPKSEISGIIAIFAAITLALICHPNTASTKSFYLSGCIINALGFYWLTDTVSVFGGFPKIFGFIVFLFFVVVSSLQFVAFSFLFKTIPLVLGAFRLPLAWFSAEFLFPKIFPWELGTPLVTFPILSQIADVGGCYFVSFILLLSAAYFVDFLFKFKSRNFYQPLLICLSLVGLWLAYGYITIKNFPFQPERDLDLALIQANVEVVQQGDISVIKQNKNRYVELTRKLDSAVELVIWPEAVLQDWFHIDLARAQDDARMPYFGPNLAFLSGALTFETQERFFNSAIYTDSGGQISKPYHKRILMPFGEYMPFSTIFPVLNEINKNLALFTAGEDVSIFSIHNKYNNVLTFSPLICYEDLIPRLSRQAVQRGAGFLVNLTNDAWFASGPAAIHHSLIASYRAIENKRYLVRSTNTGLTEIVNPFGESIAQLPPNSESVLVAKVEALEFKTFYTEYIRSSYYWFLAIFVLILSNPFKLKMSSKLR